MATITFTQRWKEELVAVSDDCILIFECTIGQLHVYFPDKDKWLASVPAWAKGKWELYITACTNWSNQNKIPMSIVGDAHVYEKKDQQ